MCRVASDRPHWHLDHLDTRGNGAPGTLTNIPSSLAQAAQITAPASCAQGTQVITHRATWGLDFFPFISKPQWTQWQGWQGWQGNAKFSWSLDGRQRLRKVPSSSTHLCTSSAVTIPVEAWQGVCNVCLQCCCLHCILKITKI